jgi:REP element-mobilizing transposase RayT
MARSKRTSQGCFGFTNWGGARRGAGRKQTSPRPRVAHGAREPLAGYFPVHVTLRLARGLPSLRREKTHREILCVLASASARSSFRCVHYSVQSNHVHLVVEAHDGRELSRGMQALCVRMARALNRAWSRSGSVFDGRYHARILRSPREVRNALAYVLRNAHHHGRTLGTPFDPFSSAAWFDGWRSADPRGRDDLASKSALPCARTWLLDRGWRRHGRMELSAVDVREPTCSCRRVATG